MTTATDWLDRTDEATDICALPLVRRVAALLDQDPALIEDGQDLPHGWHMILFTPDALQSQLGPDGHAAGGTAFAPPGLPRRMLGGRRTRFEAPLRIGSQVRRTTEVLGFQEKQGRTGRLGVATLRHTIHQAGRDAPSVIEDQDVIYREAAQDPGPPPTTQPPPAPIQPPEPDRPAPSHSRGIIPDPVLLFRYSAITFNAHRIHFDAAHATDREGYPGLVVNGGLTALLLLELFKQAAGRDPASMTVRNRLPLICNRPARLCATPASDGWALWAEDEHGKTALEASAT